MENNSNESRMKARTAKSINNSQKKKKKKNLGKKIKSNLFSFVLSLVSLAPRVLRADVSRPAPQTRLSSVKMVADASAWRPCAQAPCTAPQLKMAAADRAQKVCAQHHNSTRRWRAVRRDAAPGTATTWSHEQHSCTRPVRTTETL